MSGSEKCVILMAGLPGSGKSTLARAIAKRVKGVVLDKDAIRAGLFPAPLIEYSRRQDDFCIRILLDTAEYLFRNSAISFLFVDGRPFVLRSQVEEVAQWAERIDCRFGVIHALCTEEAAHERLQSEHLAKNRSLRLYRDLREKMEPIERPHLEVQTNLPLEVCVEQCLAYIATL